MKTGPGSDNKDKGETETLHTQGARRHGRGKVDSKVEVILLLFWQINLKVTH